MVRIGIGIAVVAAGAWLLLGRGSDAEAVTKCLGKAGATVTESPRFAQVFPYAIAARSLEPVQKYPETDGARFYSVLYGGNRAMLFVAKNADSAEAFESTLVTLVAKEGGTVSSQRSGKTLLVWERPTLATAVDHCIG